MNIWDMPQAYLVRHGETELNAENCWRGWENPSLNDAGFEAADAIQNFFSWTRVGQVISSDLRRAMQTAQHVIDGGSAASMHLSTDFNLRPWAIGAFAGMEKSAKNVRDFQKYVEDPTLKIPDTPQLPGESLDDFRLRNERLMEYIHAPYLGLPSVIVVHTSNITALQRSIAEMKGEDPGNNEETIDMVAPGGVIAVYLGIDGSMELVPRLGEITVEETPEVS